MGRQEGGLWRSKSASFAPFASFSPIHVLTDCGSGFAVEGVVHAADMVDGELVWLSNGAKGFMKGKFKA